MIKFFIWSPLMEIIEREWDANEAPLLDGTSEAEILLLGTQADVYKQFDEKQSEWKPNAEFTVKKKQANKSDMRIMHESTRKGVRLRDAYLVAGSVSDGKMFYNYPKDKPYARELQEGSSGSSKQKKKTYVSKRNKQALQKYSDDLDDAFDRLF